MKKKFILDYRQSAQFFIQTEIREFLKTISFIGDTSPFIVYQHSITDLPLKTPQQLSELLLEVTLTHFCFFLLQLEFQQRFVP